MEQKVQAQKILQQLMSEKLAYFTDFYWHTVVTVHLCDLLLFEVKSTNEPEVWEKVKTLIQQLYIQAQDRQTFGILCEVLLLQAKFAAIDEDLQRAQNFLDQARITAEEKGLGLLGQKIAIEQKRFEAELEKWQTLLQRNPSLQERVNKARLHEYFQEVQKRINLMDIRREDEMRDLDQEEGQNKNNTK